MASRRGASGVVLAVLRLAVAAVFLSAGLAKLLDHAEAERNFDHWGLPAPGALAWAVAGLEVTCALLLATGLATRLAALLLVADMVGAVVTAGRVDGGMHLVVPPVLALLSLILLARGGGWGQLLDRVDPPRPGPARR